MVFQSVKNYSGLAYPGVEVEEHPTRKFKGKPDLNFRIRFKIEKQSTTIILGYSSEGWTYAKASAEITLYKNGSKIYEKKRKAVQEAVPVVAEEKTVNELTLSEIFYEKYLIVQRAEIKASTLKSRKSSFNKWIKEPFGDKLLKDITDEDIITKIKNKMKSAKKSNATIDQAYKTLQAIFTFAKRVLKYEGRNPLGLNGVKAPKINNQRTRFLEPKEAEILMNALKEKSMKTYQMAMICLYSGMRFSEMLNLKWQDVKLENRILIAREPKNGKAREVTIPQKLIDLLTEIKVEDVKPYDLIFPRERNGHKTVQSPKIFKTTIDELGWNNNIDNNLERLCWHSLRHTYASWFMIHGGTLEVLMKQGGWSTYDMVLRYAHLKKDRTVMIDDIFGQVEEEIQPKQILT